ncbi:MAG: phenylalanine--tRNA ligase subunit alpha [Patescibacteria group bacterium]
MLDEIKKIEQSAKEALKNTQNLDDFERVRIEFLGRKGALSLLLRALKDLPEHERRTMGGLANRLRHDLEELFFEKEKILKHSIIEDSLKKEWIDITRPGIRRARGHQHPLSIIRGEIEDIFQQLGFSTIEGPEVEEEFYNFDALNVPKNHPARDLQDTFWIKSPSSKRILLRTHTSPVQIRYMRTHNPPFRIIAPGRVFRHEATDASHEFQFYQIEGLMVGRRGEAGGEISVANFKGIMAEFFRRFFKSHDLKVQLRPAYFPFVEPGFEMYISCRACNGKGCSICKRSGWIEILGAGMVHQNVFKASGYNPTEVRGFAFGMAIDRLAMMKYKIPDIRLFHSGDMRFLKQF